MIWRTWFSWPHTSFLRGLWRPFHRLVYRVPKEKITLYILNENHKYGREKCRFFQSFGFSADEWQDLEDALMIHAQTNPTVSITETEFGLRYRVECSIVCPDGR